VVVNDTYDEFSELLGAFALDAVDPAERERIELHLIECPRCRAEVTEHREVAALLSQSGAQAPDGVWDRIVAELSPAAPPMRLHLGARPDEAAAVASTSARSTDGEVRSLDDARSSRAARQPGRVAMMVASIAAAVVLVLGLVAVGQSQRLNRLETALADPSLDRLANQAVADSPVKVDMTGDAGNAEAVVRADGRGYLIMDSFPEAPEGDVYQLWGKVDEVVLSLGTFAGGDAVVPFSVDPGRVSDIELFAITQETAPGVIASERDPILVGTV
jgi:anti-sigma factor RsiW